MRLLARSPLVAIFVALALGLASSACEPTHEGATPPDAGSPIEHDAGCEPLRCRPSGLRCRDGQIVELQPIAVSPCESPTLACPEGAIVRTCERGCVEGATADHPDRLCHETRLKRPGDACVSVDDCAPSDGDPLACDLAHGVCVRVGPERCNGVDDDGDGTTDEACECEARRVAALSFLGAATDVAFGRDRVALMSSDPAAEATIRIVDAAGELLSVHEGLRYARRVAWVDDTLVVVLQEGTTGSSTLVQLHADGSESRVTLERTAPGDRTWVIPDGEGWILVTPVRSTSLGITRHAAGGARTGWTQASGISDVVFVASQGGPRYLGLVGSPGLAILSSALELVPASMPGGVIAPYDAAPAGDALVFLTITHEGRPGIVVRDASGEVSGPRELRDADHLGRGARVAAERDGERIAVAWRGPDRVRVHVARGEDLERVGEIAVSAPYDATFALGDAGAGLRLVVGQAGQWEIHDPCPAE